MIICKDCIRADLTVTFFIGVRRTAEDVLTVAQTIGAERASNTETLKELFVAQFSQALAVVAQNLDFVELYTHRNDFIDKTIETIGEDLNGYRLDNLAIDFLEQTPVEALDKNNILDAKGILKITELTSSREIAANEILHEKALRLAKLGLEAKEQLIEIERRQGDALAKLHADSGKELTVEQLEDRLTEGLREMVDIAVQERLGREG